MWRERVRKHRTRRRRRRAQIETVCLHLVCVCCVISALSERISLYSVVVGIRDNVSTPEQILYNMYLVRWFAVVVVWVRVVVDIAIVVVSL